MALPINGHADLLARLEKGFNEQQTSFQSTRDDVSGLKTGYNVIQRDIVSLTTTIDKLIARFEDSRKINWPLFALLGGFVPILIGGTGYFMTSFTGNAISPVHAEIVALQTTTHSLADQIKDEADIQTTRGKEISLLTQTAGANSEILSRITTNLHTIEAEVAASTAADVQSRTDREQINARVGKLESEQAGDQAFVRAALAATRVQLGEIEEQFHSVSNMENLRAAQQERLNSIMWEKSHPGERYPNSTFFPTSIFQGSGGSPPMPGIGSSGGP